VFQFPLHRDPRCNRRPTSPHSRRHWVSVPFTSGSSLQHKLVIIWDFYPFVSVPFTSGSSLQRRQAARGVFCLYSFSSLYIGILAATKDIYEMMQQIKRFSSLYIGILAATFFSVGGRSVLHRFSSLYIGILAATEGSAERSEASNLFQFPLHRDPRCNR